MFTSPLRRIPLLLLAAVLVSQASPVGAATPNDEFLDAMRLYHNDHYPAAFGRLAELADGGHPESARIALLMLRHGPRLYRNQWSATREQVLHWLDVATVRPKIAVADGAD